MTASQLQRRQDYALQFLLLEIATRQALMVSSRGFQLIDGDWVSYTAGQAALHSGTALLVGDFLVGVAPSEGRVE